MHLAPSIFGSNIHSLLEKAFPETASIGFIGIIYLPDGSPVPEEIGFSWLASSSFIISSTFRTRSYSFI